MRFSILHAPARLHSGRSGETFERGADERVAAEAVDAELGRLLDLDPVDEVDPLEDGQHLVLAVVARRPDDEREVDLRRGGRAHHVTVTSSVRSRGPSNSAR